MTRGALGAAARIALGAPRLWAIALAGFLARGGIVLLAAPILVFPSVVGFVTFLGPGAVTSAGVSSRFVALAAASAAVVVGWLVLGLLVGAAADLLLIDAVAAPSASRQRGSRLVGRLVVIRLVSLVPFGVALAVAGVRLFDVGYQEILLPTDATTPLAARILRGAPDAIAILVLGWVLAEVEGAVATRLAVIRGRGALASLVAAPGWMIRRPSTTVRTTFATLAGTALVLGPALTASGAAWAIAQGALLAADGWPLGLAAVLVFVAVWVGGLVLAGLVAAWRSVAWTLVVERDHRGAGARPSDGGTL